MKPLCAKDRKHGGAACRGMCMPCYERERRNGTLEYHPRRYRRATDVLEDCEWLRRQGLGRDEIAARLGYRSRAGLDQVLYRASRRGVLAGAS